jgi:hypothetical protein
MAWLELPIEIQDAQKVGVGSIPNSARWGVLQMSFYGSILEFVA